MDARKAVNSSAHVMQYRNVIVATAKSCTGDGVNGWQHGIKGCLQCHKLRCDKDAAAKQAVANAEKLHHAAELMAKTEVDMIFAAPLSRSLSK